MRKLISRAATFALSIAVAIAAGSASAGEDNIARGFAVKAWKQSSHELWVDDCGARGDVQRLTNAAMAAGSATLTQTGASFTASDVGKLIYVNKADATGTGVLKSTITAVNSSTSITLANANASGVAISGVTAFYGHDSTAPVATCKAKADALGVPLMFSGGGYSAGGAYLIRGSLQLTSAGLVGQAASVNGNAPQTYLIFAELGTSPALQTTQASTKQPIRIENLYIEPVGWDATNGSAGYGLDMEYRVLMRNTRIFSFASSCVFAHQSTGGNGPYGSRIETSSFSNCGKHGFVVGTGANSITLDRDDFKYNGAPGFGLSPSVAGSYDGLFVSVSGDGNPGSAYPAYNPQDLTILGGDASYNSRYGWNFDTFRNSTVNPGYAELNLGDGSTGTVKQARVGSASYAKINFNVLDPTALVSAQSDSTAAQTTTVWAGGANLGSGLLINGFPSAFDLQVANSGQQHLYTYQTTGDGSGVYMVAPLEGNTNFATAALQLTATGNSGAIALGGSPNAFVSGAQGGHFYMQVGNGGSTKLNFFGGAGNKRVQYGTTIQSVAGTRGDCAAGSLIDGLAAYGLVSDNTTGTCFTAANAANNLSDLASPSTARVNLGLTAATAGSIPYLGATGAWTEDNANLFWDGTNHRLGLGTAAPTHPLTVSSSEFAGSTLGACYYNTLDQVTNYSRLCFDYESSANTWKTQVGGTGTPRGVAWNLNSGFNVVAFGASSPAAGVNSFAVSTSSTNMPYVGISGTSTASSGTVSALSVTPTWNQSGTAAGNALLINPTKTAEGTGEHDLIRAQLGGVDVYVLGENGHTEFKGTAPTVSACGTSPTIAGNDSAGRVTVGTSPATSCTITFAAAWTNAPICSVYDETTAVLVRPASTTTSVVSFAGSIAANDNLAYRCVGYR